MRRSFVLVAVLLSFCAGPASAQQSLEDRLREQLRSTVAQLRELQDREATLQAQKAAAEQERDTARKELEAMRAQLAAAKGNTRERAALQQTVAQYRSAAQQATTAAQQKEAARAELETQLAARSAILDACMAKNTQLYHVGLEILDAYQKFDLGDALGANEPFIKIHRVDLENIAQNYGDQLYDGQFDPRSVQTPPPGAASSAAPPPAPAPAAAPAPSPPPASGSAPQQAR